MTEWLLAVLKYLPYYIGLVVTPAIISMSILSRYYVGKEVFDEGVEAPSYLRKYFSMNVLVESIDVIEASDIATYIVINGLTAPLIEETLFRGIPYIVFGFYGLVFGSLVWTILHVPTRITYFTNPRIALAVLSAYFGLASVFYSLPWINGEGWVALFYHAFHNTMLTIGELYKYYYRKEKSTISSVREEPIVPIRKYVVEEKAKLRIVEEEEEGGGEEEVVVGKHSIGKYVEEVEEEEGVVVVEEGGRQGKYVIEEM